jgi:ATPase subunit of ABC transporter with duplicated ATPase domains
LDLESINALNFALQKYQGTVLLVTHDHDLIDEVATRIWYFQGGKIEDFKGPYADFVAEQQVKAAQGAQKAQSGRPQRNPVRQGAISR